MKYINLIDKLTKEDKDALTAYITKFGCSRNFIGLDKWLENWSHANQKLYRLLGNSFIKKTDIQYDKNKDDILRDMTTFLYNSTFKDIYNTFYWDFCKAKREEYNFTDENIKFFNHLLDVNHFINNEIKIGIKYKKPNGKKILQIQPGTKPLKAVYRVIEYFKEDWEYWEDALPAFETFKKDFGIISSDKKITGTLCISIHPLDYITMSDNNSNWSSCMSWQDEGCYHVGTIEMMNSNNVLCCYLTNNNTPFVFDETINPDTGKTIGVWNNKKWRQLFYFTKDIIMGGKPYPYVCKDITIRILNDIKSLANDNLNYTYEFGPELYKDMIHVTSNSRMQNQKMWAKSHSSKQNIIWDTKGMYNDMLNDVNTEYWCYRNKVAHTKVISVSGKANCLCCNNSIIKFCEKEKFYNDRYSGTGYSVCKDCVRDYFTCNYCGLTKFFDELHDMKNSKKICNVCIKSFKKCPFCGKFFLVDFKDTLPTIYINDYLFNQIQEHKIDLGKLAKERGTSTRAFSSKENWNYLMSEFITSDGPIPLDKAICCPNCRKNNVEKELKHQALFAGKIDRSFWFSMYEDVYLLPPELSQNYRLTNLKTATLEDLQKLTL